MKLGWKRLLKLADILDVADAEHKAKGEPAYRQNSFLHECGSPACALGHWAIYNVRKNRLGWSTRRDEWRVRLLWNDSSMANLEGAESDFGISRYEICDLFGLGGCGQAKTAKQAARYIRRFVKQKQAELAEARKAEAGE